MPDDPQPARAGPEERLPSGRVARTARFGRMVAGQGLRWAGMQAGNLARDEDARARAQSERAVELADELVTQLGQMKGAAMKLGQVLSTFDFEVVPPGERERFKQRLAALRDAAPRVPFRQMRRLLEDELGGPLSERFEQFDEEAFAAASIGQVHRAVTHDGQEVAVKVQYPGIAEAVETDLRNLNLLLPLVKRLAPGLDTRALAAELRERIGEELDYEIEAQSQRRVARAYRGHPFVRIPAVVTALSTRRVLVSELVHGEPFDAVKRRPEPERDRFGEIVFRFYFGLVTHTRLVSGDPHPGNYLLCPDGRVCFLDFGLMRQVPAAYLAKERELARAVTAGRAQEVHALMAELGYLPDPASFDPERILEQIQAAGAWYLQPGVVRLDPEYVRQTIEVSGSPRSPWFDQMRRQTVPPEALLLRRMEGLIFSVLGELRAAADWHALACESFADAAPSTPLGEEEAAFWAGRAPAPVTW
jgi:predicted unusual protein kinase regulating ubiquinone biosynthesis (AarF/ABC1/UbiB family)